MSMLSFIRISAFLLFTVACNCFGQSVKERIQESEFKLYTVVFGVTVGVDSKVQSMRVAQVMDAKSGKRDAVDIEVPEVYLDAVKKKVEEKNPQPKYKDGKVAEFFTYYVYTPEAPTVVIADLDLALDKQP